MKKKYAALLVAAAIMAVPGTLAMAAGSPNTNATVSHGGGHSSSASSKSAGLNVNAGTITNKTTTGIKNNGQNQLQPWAMLRTSSCISTMRQPMHGNWQL